MLEGDSIKLSAVASSMTTVSARAMLGALIAGEWDPRMLAELAQTRMRQKIPALTEALTVHLVAAPASEPAVLQRAEGPARWVRRCGGTGRR